MQSENIRIWIRRIFQLLALLCHFYNALLCYIFTRITNATWALNWIPTRAHVLPLPPDSEGLETAFGSIFLWLLLFSSRKQVTSIIFFYDLHRFYVKSPLKPVLVYDTKRYKAKHRTNEPPYIWNLSLHRQFMVWNSIDAIYYVSKCKAPIGYRRNGGNERLSTQPSSHRIQDVNYRYYPLRTLFIQSYCTLI